MFDADAAIGPATNAATASSASTVDPNPGNDTGATTADVTGNADVSVVKTADPATAVPGDPIEFRISAHNAGPSTARAVTVSDALPADFEFETAVATQGTCDAPADGGVACAVGDIPSGATVDVTVDDDGPRRLPRHRRGEHGDGRRP